MGIESEHNEIENLYILVQHASPMTFAFFKREWPVSKTSLPAYVAEQKITQSIIIITSSWS